MVPISEYSFSSENDTLSKYLVPTMISYPNAKVPSSNCEQ